jgi:hypothetical protein
MGKTPDLPVAVFVGNVQQYGKKTPDLDHLGAEQMDVIFHCSN